jgi:hypothetical protein
MELQADLRFGALVVKNGFASESDVEFALETQRETSDEGMAPPLGEILAEMGALTPEKINALLVEQNVLRGGVVDEPQFEDQVFTPAVVPSAEAAKEPGSPAPAPEAAATPPEPGAKAKAFKAFLGAAVGAAGGLSRKLFERFSGKKEKEKAAALEKRDELLCRIGKAALVGGAAGAEADAARKFSDGLEAAKKKADQPAEGRAAMAAKAGLKVAETKNRMALVKLARILIEKAQVPADQEATVAELKTVEAKIAELS